MDRSNRRSHRSIRALCVTAIGGAFVILASAQLGGRGEPEPVPASQTPAQLVATTQEELGKLLFFDGRLSGDGSTSCATCHDPAKSWTDGLPLAAGYPGALYFRNTPTVLNAVDAEYFYWDGRLAATDVPTLVRDHISEAHFMQADGRLVIEQLRQVPAYELAFGEVFGGEPTYGRILIAVSAYLRTLHSRNVPYDRYRRGRAGAISASARRGLSLFEGKAGCTQCHDGPRLSDSDFHNLGLATNPDIFQTPERHIVFRRFFKMLGVPRYANLREDVGLYGVTKQTADRGRFRTPSLREVSNTAPYMHDGSLATLADVVEFFDRGGGPGGGKDPLLKPLGLADDEKQDLIAFLETLAGDPIPVGTIELPPYALRGPGEN